MFNVFSEFCLPGLSVKETLSKRSRLAGNKYDYTLFFAEDEPRWLMKPEAEHVLIWINNKILYQLLDMDYITMGVRLRIATNMLNKLTQQNIISKDISILYHDRFIERIKGIYSAAMTEDLPF